MTFPEETSDKTEDLTAEAPKAGAPEDSASGIREEAAAEVPEEAAPEEAAPAKPEPVSEPEPAAAAPVEEGISPEVVAVIAAAVASMGCAGTVKAIRPIERNNWKNSGRNAIQSRG